MIAHVVTAASWGDKTAGQNQALTTVIAGDGGVLGAVTLLKALSV
jgi:hypothetical protein